VVEKWWNGMAAAEEDMNPASAPGLGMKSASADEEAPAMAAIEDRTWQSPNILPRPAGRSTERKKQMENPSLLLLSSLSLAGLMTVFLQIDASG